MKNLAKTLLPVLLAAAAACAHAPAPGSYRAAPEPLTADGSAAFDERNPGVSRELAALDAEKNALRRTAGLFMDEASAADNYPALEIGLLKTPQLYVAKRKVISEGQDGASYRVRAKVWVYHDKIASALRGMNLAGTDAAATVAAFVQRGPADKTFSAAFREAFSRRSAITIKDFPFASDAGLLSGPDQPVLDAADDAGADLLFSVSASAVPSGAGLNTGFYPSRAEASLKILDVKTGRELLSLSSQANAIDSSEAASFAKAMASAGELLAAEAAGKADRLLKQDTAVKLRFLGLDGLETLEKLKAQLLRTDLKGLRLVSYSDGAAVFSAVPRQPDPQEFASVILRGDSLGLQLEGVAGQEVVFSMSR